MVCLPAIWVEGTGFCHNHDRFHKGGSHGQRTWIQRLPQKSSHNGKQGLWTTLKTESLRLCLLNESFILWLVSYIWFSSPELLCCAAWCSGKYHCLITLMFLDHTWTCSFVASLISSTFYRKRNLWSANYPWLQLCSLRWNCLIGVPDRYVPFLCQWLGSPSGECFKTTAVEVGVLWVSLLSLELVLGPAYVDLQASYKNEHKSPIFVFFSFLSHDSIFNNILWFACGPTKRSIYLDQ